MTISFFTYKILLVGVLMSLDKIVFILENKFRYLSSEELVYKALQDNFLVSKLAIQELVRRNPMFIDVDDSLIIKVINKMTIEDIWSIASLKRNTKLFSFAYQKLNSILEYYDELYKKNEIKSKLKLL